jgi:hypothetical protein
MTDATRQPIELELPLGARGVLRLAEASGRPAAWASGIVARQRPLLDANLGAGILRRLSLEAAPGVWAASLARRFGADSLRLPEIDAPLAPFARRSRPLGPALARTSYPAAARLSAPPALAPQHSGAAPGYEPPPASAAASPQVQRAPQAPAPRSLARHADAAPLAPHTPDAAPGATPPALESDALLGDLAALGWGAPTSPLPTQANPGVARQHAGGARPQIQPNKLARLADAAPQADPAQPSPPLAQTSRAPAGSDVAASAPTSPTVAPTASPQPALVTAATRPIALLRQLPADPLQRMGATNAATNERMPEAPHLAQRPSAASPPFQGRPLPLADAYGTPRDSSTPGSPPNSAFAARAPARFVARQPAPGASGPSDTPAPAPDIVRDPAPSGNALGSYPSNFSPPAAGDRGAHPTTPSSATTTPSSDADAPRLAVSTPPTPSPDADAPRLAVSTTAATDPEIARRIALAGPAGYLPHPSPMPLAQRDLARSTPLVSRSAAGQAPAAPALPAPSPISPSAAGQAPAAPALPAPSPISPSAAGQAPTAPMLPAVPLVSRNAAGQAPAAPALPAVPLVSHNAAGQAPTAPALVALRLAERVAAAPTLVRQTPSGSPTLALARQAAAGPAVYQRHGWAAPPPTPPLRLAQAVPGTRTWASTSYGDGGAHESLRPTSRPGTADGLTWRGLAFADSIASRVADMQLHSAADPHEMLFEQAAVRSSLAGEEPGSTWPPETPLARSIDLAALGHAPGQQQGLAAELPFTLSGFAAGPAPASARVSTASRAPAEGGSRPLAAALPLDLARQAPPQASEQIARQAEAAAHAATNDEPGAAAQAAPGHGSAAGAKSSEVDVEQLARRVYEHLCRQLRVERERTGRF